MTIPLFIIYDAGIDPEDPERFKKGPLLSALLGMLLGITIGILSNILRDYIMKKSQKKWIDTDSLLGDIMLLVKYVALSDEDLSFKEMRYVLKKVERYYPQKVVDKIDEILHNPSVIDFNAITKRIDRFYNESDKKRVMNLLIGVSISDQYLKNVEYEAVVAVAKAIKYPKVLVDYTYDRYNFTTEEDERYNEYKRKQRDKEAFDKVDHALSVLGLHGDPSVEEIKDAYRKLVKELHPDKNIKKPDWEIRLNEEQFHQVQIAYEYLKDKKDF